MLCDKMAQLDCFQPQFVTMSRKGIMFFLEMHLLAFLQQVRGEDQYHSCVCTLNTVWSYRQENGWVSVAKVITTLSWL